VVDGGRGSSSLEGRRCRVVVVQVLEPLLYRGLDDHYTHPSKAGEGKDGKVKVTGSEGQRNLKRLGPARGRGRSSRARPG